MTKRKHNNQKTNTEMLEKIQAWHYLVFTLLLTIFSYSSGMSGDFLLDDVYLLVKNPFHQNLSEILGVFTRPYWSGTEAANNLVYRPMVSLTYILNWQIASGSAIGFHLFNLLLHLTNIALLFYFTLQWTESRPLAFLVSTMFSVHPLFSEAVYGISYRTDLLAMAFALGSVILWQKKGWWEPALLYFLAMLCKESAILLGPLIPLASWQRLKSKNGQWAVAMMGLAVIGYFSLRFIALGQFLPAAQQIPLLDNPMSHVDLSSRLVTALEVLGRYWLLLLWPLTLSYDYSFNQIPVTPDWSALAFMGLLIHLALIYFLTQPRSRSSKLVAFGIAMYLLLIAVTSNIFYTIPNIMAERFMYMPGAGICLFAMAILWSRFHNARYTLLSLVLLVCVAWGVRTHVRGYDWRSKESLYTSGVNTAPQSARAHFNYGNALYEQGKIKEALLSYQLALKIYPDFVMALTNLCVVLANQGNYSEARKACARALALNPGFPMAQKAMAFIQDKGG